MGCVAEEDARWCGDLVFGEEVGTVMQTGRHQRIQSAIGFRFLGSSMSGDEPSTLSPALQCLGWF